ncbi:MAG: endolytic transglycosylase MltG [Hymenobacter sp.]
MALAVVAAVAILTTRWYANALKPTGTEEQAIVVKDGATPKQVAAELADRKLIKSAAAFRWHVSRTGLGKDIKAGRYRLDGRTPSPEIAKALAAGPQADANRFTVKEGQTQQTIANTLSKLGGFDRQEFANLKAKDFTGYDFLKDLPDDATLEGFLFPETYEIPPPETATKEVATVLLNQFQKELAPQLSQLRASSRSLFDTVTVASIVEVEVRSDEDRRLVAGIIYRRLREDIRLDADATLRYGIDKPTEALTKSDLDSDNPYNTRKHKGLPPGPVSNPGIASLKAATNPQASDYLFYLSAKDGTTVFARTLEEHEANVEQYLAVAQQAADP